MPCNMYNTIIVTTNGLQPQKTNMKANGILKITKYIIHQSQSLGFKYTKNMNTYCICSRYLHGELSEYTIMP
jgi:hypothetical protein